MPSELTNKDYISILNMYKEKCINDIKEITINYSKMLDQRELKIRTIELNINNIKLDIKKDVDKLLYPTFKNCPKCTGLLGKRKGQFGFFYGCSNYPNCKYTLRID
jgi:hypothetical protein